MSADLEPASEAVWRCLRTKPKSEHVAAGYLKALPELELFCPRIRHRKATRRGQVWFVEALFPGYLFAKCDWSARQRIVLASSGVTGLVHFGSYVPEVPSQVISQLRSSFAGEEMLTVAAPFGVGDAVEVGEGPFRGVEATVTRLLPAHNRIAILLNFLGSVREVEVSLLSVLGVKDVRQTALAIS